MFQLSLQDIHLNKIASNKQEAIAQIAAALEQSGCVKAGYGESMLQRDQQISTYLGNGIAIPHGTVDMRDSVLKTGAKVFQFPQGVVWDETGQKAYVAIGIAASSDEHLSLLSQLTQILSDEDIAQKLAQSDSAEKLHSLLISGDRSAEFNFDASMIALDVCAESLITLNAINAGRLQKVGAVNKAFVCDVLSNKPLNLGQGVWLSDSREGNLCSAVAISRPIQPFEEEGEQVALLVTVAIVDNSPFNVLNCLSDLLQAGHAQRLLKADVSQILMMLTQPLAEQDAQLQAEFVIRNEHGLHARPGTTLVNTIKKFSSDITVTNLDGSGKPANGRSLMKVVALGVKKGHRLRISASGQDAQAALEAIGEAIRSGLGEEAI